MNYIRTLLLIMLVTLITSIAESGNDKQPTTLMNRIAQYRNAQTKMCTIITKISEADPDDHIQRVQLWNRYLIIQTKQKTLTKNHPEVLNYLEVGASCETIAKRPTTPDEVTFSFPYCRANSPDVPMK